MLNFKSWLITLLYLIWIYCLLIPYAVDPSYRWITAVAFWLVAVGALYRFASYIWHVLMHSDEPWQHALDFCSIYICVTHSFAALGMTLYILGGLEWIQGINPSASAYSIFVGDFLFVVVNIYSRAGWVNINPRPSTVLGPLWGMFISVTGMIALSVLLALILRGIKKMAPLSENVLKQCYKLQAQIVPSFRADYGGLAEEGVNHQIRGPIINLIGRRTRKIN